MHYKEVMSSSPEVDTSVAVVLVHSFGGGVFAWRHVMEALALQCGCRVVAFDRPAFGESLVGFAQTDCIPYQYTMLLWRCCFAACLPFLHYLMAV